MNKITLRSWQQDALGQAVDRYAEGQKLFLTHATPGGGKTIHGLSTLDEMSKHGMVTHVVILAPSTVLVSQWQSDAKTNYGMELKNGMLYNQMADFHEYRGIVMTYQGMNESAESLRIFCANNQVLVIADEIHHVADGQSWGDSFRIAFEPCKYILALTGTPWASNGKRIAYVNYGDDGYSIPDFSYDKKTAIRDKVCRVTQFIPSVASDLRFVDEVTGEISEYSTLEKAIEAEERGAYRKTLESIKHMKSMFMKADTQLSELRTVISDAGGLIVAPSIESAHLFKDEIFMLTGREYPIVHSKMDSPDKKISHFRGSTDRWLISVDMVTEGVDIKRLMVCVFLSSKNTELFLRQVIGRIERVRYPNHDADSAGYFHHTYVKEINDVVAKLIEENKAGLALKESNISDETETVKRTPRDDSVTLEDVKTMQVGLIAMGYTYSDDVVAEAMILKSKSQLLADVALYIVCKFVMSQRADNLVPAEIQSSNFDDVPLTEKKIRIRSRIAKEVNRKLNRMMSGQVRGDQIKQAHWQINQRIGISKTDDDISLEQLEAKLEYVTSTEATSWR
jgi:superfamily II DNA or RNA helicase